MVPTFSASGVPTRVWKIIFEVSEGHFRLLRVRADIRVTLCFATTIRLVCTRPKCRSRGALTVFRTDLSLMIYPCLSKEYPMTFINPRELGARWRVSTKTLERWRNEGCGPAYMKLHGRVLYRLAEVESFEMQQTQQTSSGTRRTHRRRGEQFPARLCATQLGGHR